MRDEEFVQAFLLARSALVQQIECPEEPWPQETLLAILKKVNEQVLRIPLPGAGYEVPGT